MAKNIPPLPPSTELAEDLDASLRQDPLAFESTSRMADHVGWSRQRLAQETRVHFHYDPEDLLRRRHLERAARDLRSSRLSIAEIVERHARVLETGFESSFRQRYALSPRAYRDLGAQPELELELPAWFRRERTLAYLGRDPGSLTERVEGHRFTFATRLEGRALAVGVEVETDRASIAVPAGLSPDTVRQLHQRVLRYLGLVIDPRAFERRRNPSAIRRLVDNLRGLSIPQTPTPFDGLLWVVAGQQVSLAVAFSLRRKLTRALGDPAGDDLWVPPRPETVAAVSTEELRTLGYSRAKADYLLGLSRAVADGALDLEALGRVSALRLERELSRQRGLGPWSVQYLRMRSFGLADCVPVGDAALRRNLVRFFGLESAPDARRTLELMAPFAPHRSLASFHFWSLESRAQ